MNKSEIRKKILKIRKINYHKNQKINFKSLLKILKKTKINNKVIGGYYPYNYECDTIEIFKKLEKLKYHLSLPKDKKKLSNEFFSVVNKRPIRNK